MKFVRLIFASPLFILGGIFMTIGCILTLSSAIIMGTQYRDMLNDALRKILPPVE